MACPVSLKRVLLYNFKNFIGDYEKKSKNALIKVLSEPKPKIKIDKKKLEDIRKDFIELRHKFSKKERDKYRKGFSWYKKLQVPFSIRNREGKKKSC